MEERRGRARHAEPPPPPKKKPLLFGRLSDTRHMGFVGGYAVAVSCSVLQSEDLAPLVYLSKDDQKAEGAERCLGCIGHLTESLQGS